MSDNFVLLQTYLFHNYRLLYQVGRMSSVHLIQVEVYYSQLQHIKQLRDLSEWPNLGSYLILLVIHYITRWEWTKMAYHTTVAFVGQTQLKVVFTCQSVAHLGHCVHLLNSQMLCYATFVIIKMLQLDVSIALESISTLILMIGLVMRLLNLLQRLAFHHHFQFQTFWQLVL